MLICETRKQIFNHNPKTGGIAIGHWLQRHYGYVPAIEDLDAPVSTTPGSIVWRHQTGLPPGRGGGYEIWCVVRHPLRRWASFYNYCRRWIPGCGELSFEEFTTEQRVAWLPVQESYVRASRYWFQLEHLAEGLTELGLAQHLAELPVENAGGYAPPWPSWSRRARELVTDRFHYDFRACGYRLPR